MPVSGMTGFGRADGAFADWTWTVEARSVNGRSLEVRFKGPPGFDALERMARDQAQALFQRGQLSVTVTARRSERAAAPRVNTAALEAYLALADRYVAAGRVDRPTMDGLLALRGVLEAGDDEDPPEARAQITVAMGEAIAAALGDLKLARKAEGAALRQLLEGMTGTIRELARSARSQAAEQPEDLRDRFARRMRELIGEASGTDLEARIIQEASVLAAKADVREEIDRLEAHIDQAGELLAAEGPAGRKLDFLAQEFMREANTLCSKSANTRLTRTGLDLKAVIDQFKEQVQNVE